MKKNSPIAPTAQPAPTTDAGAERSRPVVEIADVPTPRKRAASAAGARRGKPKSAAKAAASDKTAATGKTAVDGDVLDMDGSEDADITTEPFEEQDAIDAGADPMPLPHRLNLTHSNGKRAIVLIKDREKPAQAFTKEQMALPLPQDAPLLPLAKFKQQQ